MFHLHSEVLQDFYHALAVHGVSFEGNLFADRLAFPCGLDRPVILTEHKVRELAPLLPKEGMQVLFAQALEIGPVCYAQFPELRGGHLANAKEFVDRQRVKKGRSLLWGCYHETIRFVGI